MYRDTWCYTSGVHITSSIFRYGIVTLNSMLAIAKAPQNEVYDLLSEQQRQFLNNL
ncbi:MAG: hypothetical protein RMY28_034620 [Nostoc sp. ChiSLP01]|nr:hypothetical protein [Nostoc sp. CmiSLP01]MDZ8287519.1 hypothetical protein [Nostoc sp. ChiSLP01]